MRIRLFALISAALFVTLAVLCGSTTSWAGPLQPLASPEASAQVSLQDLRDRLSGKSVSPTLGFDGPDGSPAASEPIDKTALQDLLDRIEMLEMAPPQGGALPPYPPSWLALPATTTSTQDRGMAFPMPRFTVDVAKGIVTDRFTGLIWLYNANCFNNVPYSKPSATKTPATTLVASLASGQCGLNDGSVAGEWRIPAVTELESLVDYRHFPHLSDVTGTLPFNTAGATAPFSNFITSYYLTNTIINPTAAASLIARYTISVATGQRSQVRDNYETDTAYLLPVKGGSFRGPVAVAQVNGSTSVGIGSTVTLKGTSSYQPGSTAQTPAPSYRWSLTVPVGSGAVLSNPNTANPTFVADQAGQYIAKLVVNFGTWDSEISQVIVTAAAP